MVWGSTVLVCAESSAQVFSVHSVTSVMDMHILIRHEPEKAWMATLICSDGSGQLDQRCFQEHHLLQRLRRLQE